MSQQSYKKPFLIIFLIVATELIGFGLIIPVLPQISLRFETNMLLLGILMSAYSFAQFFAAPILGQLSDRFGRKKILVLSKFGTCISYIILAYSQHYWGFLIARLLDGVTGGNISVARAYIVDITKPQDRSKGMAIIGISFGVGFVLGPALGGLLYGDKTGHMIPALVSGALSFLALLFTVFLLEEPKKHRESKVGLTNLLSGFKSLKDRAILIICSTQLLYMIIFSGFETTLSLFTESNFGLTVKENSWLFVYAGVLGIVFQGSIARRVFKNIKRVIFIGCCCVGVGFISFSLFNTLFIFLIALAIFSIGIALVNVFLPSLLSYYIPKGQEGSIMGVYEGVGSLSRIIGPLLAYTSVVNMLNGGYLGYGILVICIGGFLYGFLKPELLSKVET